MTKNIIPIEEFEARVKKTQAAMAKENVDFIISGAGLPLSLPEFAAGSTAKLIPITSPLVFKRGPPEFPGLTAASVCIKESIDPLPSKSLPFALTIPAVTVDVKLYGFPTANIKVILCRLCRIYQ